MADSVRRIAAIDIGTVTARLLIADVAPGSITEISRSTDITHLGEGLSRTGRLSAQAMDRVADVVAGYAEAIAEAGVERTVAVATSASRDAANGDELLNRMAGLGFVPRIIDGPREAELAFAGATFELEGDDILVVDCGGGSTELVSGAAGPDAGVAGYRIDFARSVDVGSRRMTDLHMGDDPPTPAQLDRAREWAAGELGPYFERLEARPRLMVAVAGTATSLVSVQLELEPYDPEMVHGFRITGPQVADLLELFCSRTLEERRTLPGLHPDRAGVIIAGTLILETVLALSGLDQMMVSEHDTLYGILMGAYADLQESVG